MSDRTFVDGNFIQEDLSAPGFGKLIGTPGDNVGTVGQVLTSRGAGQQPDFDDLPSTSVGNATINFQRFNSSSSWGKPAGLHASSPVLVRLYPGGGGGGLGATAGGGGGGGPIEFWTTLGALGVTETVTVGAGGLGRVTTSSAGGNGGLSSFGAFVSTPVGGLGGGNAGNGGDGSGPIAAAKGRIYHDIATPRYNGQGGAASVPGDDGIWHGGGGGSNSGTSNGFNAGGSLYGGGGGAGTNGTTTGTPGTSVNAGNGGAAGVNGASAAAGVQPAGGGGAAENTGGASSGAGGAGRVDVIVFGFPA